MSQKRDWHGGHLGKARWKELTGQKVERAIQAAQVIRVPRESQCWAMGTIFATHGILTTILRHHHGSLSGFGDDSRIPHLPWPVVYHGEP